VVTPKTACKLALTIEGHAAQSMFFTERVIVLSAAIAAGNAITTAANRGQQICSCWPSSHEVRRKGAMKSRPSTAATRIVARTSLALTMRFGRGRTQASPSAQARVPDL